VAALLARHPGADTLPLMHPMSANLGVYSSAFLEGQRGRLEERLGAVAGVVGREQRKVRCVMTRPMPCGSNLSDMMLPLLP
jgi:hypothetical protein